MLRLGLCLSSALKVSWRGLNYLHTQNPPVVHRALAHIGQDSKIFQNSHCLSRRNLLNSQNSCVLKQDRQIGIIFLYPTGSFWLGAQSMLYTVHNCWETVDNSLISWQRGRSKEKPKGLGVVRLDSLRLCRSREQGNVCRAFNRVPALGPRLHNIDMLQLLQLLHVKLTDRTEMCSLCPRRHQRRKYPCWLKI